MGNEMLSLARQHVIDGRRIVERQRKLVRQREAHGFDAVEARQTLEVFERTLAIFEEHLRALEGSAEKEP
jgi:hypothetical protein